MSAENPSIWGKKSDSNNQADLIGWQDEQGHRHKGVPPQNLQDVDGLIINVFPKNDPERSKIFTVYKVNRIPDLDRWLRLITITAGYYGLSLEYDVE